jgi:uncharacterized protein YlxP (DUF503 family)
MPAVIGLLTIELQIPAAGSLKDKRQVVRSLVARLRQETNVSVAEVDHLDSWQLCTLAAVCVSNDVTVAQQLLQHVIGLVDARAIDYIVLDYQTEML